MLKSDLRNEECCLVIDAHQTGFWKLAWVNGPVAERVNDFETGDARV
jgi:hypothetical protein